MKYTLEGSHYAARDYTDINDGSDNKVEFIIGVPQQPIGPATEGKDQTEERENTDKKWTGQKCFVDVVENGQTRNTDSRI